MDVGDEPPAEARAHALFKARQIGGRLVGGNDDLPVLIHQRIECVEKFFLRRVFAADELHIVDHQQIDRAELVLEVHRRAEAQGPDELVHEFFGGQIDDLAARRLHADMPGDRMHQMRLAEPDAAIEEERVERHAMRR